MAKKYWLMKSEPEVFSIDHLSRDKTTWWEGVRNYQARNFMMNDMNPGDEVLFYHSNGEPPCIAGFARVAAKAQPDQSQFDRKSEYFDKTASTEKPRWFCVQIEFIKKLKEPLSLEQIKKIKGLAGMVLLQKGSRLSVQPVTAAEFELIKKQSL
jgi:predicted RNA-binding protein with PUA-like domain